jgi:putative membrane protein
MTASLAWQPHPETWLLVATLVTLYVTAVTYVGPKKVPAGTPPASTTQKLCFLAGVLALWVSEDWPLHEIAEDFLFSGHMLQHILFAYVAPPLLLLGMPAWMLRSLLGKGLRFDLFRFFSKPLIAFVLLNGIIAAMHWEPVVNLQSENTTFHLAFHVAMITFGLLTWTNVVTPLPELGRMAEPVKMMYLFGLSIIPTVPSSFLTFSEAPLYSFYEGVPRLWGIDILTDQRVAGLLMKIGGGLLLWGIITVMFFKWHSKEESLSVDSAVDQVDWNDFERELEVWDLKK